MSQAKVGWVVILVTLATISFLFFLGRIGLFVRSVYYHVVPSAAPISSHYKPNKICEDSYRGMIDHRGEGR